MRSSPVLFSSSANPPGKVVVVGGGLAGLSAAVEAVKAGVSLSFFFLFSLYFIFLFFFIQYFLFKRIQTQFEVEVDKHFFRLKKQYVAKKCMGLCVHVSFCFVQTFFGKFIKTEKIRKKENSSNYLWIK